MLRSEDEADPFVLQEVDDIGVRSAKHKNTTHHSFVLFVHGLGGNPEKTWQKFPEYLFHSRLSPDVGTYEFISGWRKLLPTVKGDLGFYVDQLVYNIRKLAKEYQHVFVVSHSMGGLLALGALQLLFQERERFVEIVEQAVERQADHRSPLAGIFLFATPLEGSTAVPGPLAHLNEEARLLKLFSRQQLSVRQFVTDQIEVHNTASPGAQRTWVVPMFAAFGSDDAVVHQMSATVNVPSRQLLPAKATHGSLVKPTSPDAEAVCWVVDKCFEVISTRTLPKPNALAGAIPPAARGNYKPSGVVVDLRAFGDNAGTWRRIYSEVCANTRGLAVQIFDRQAVPRDFKPLGNGRFIVSSDDLSSAEQTGPAAESISWVLDFAQQDFTTGGIAYVGPTVTAVSSLEQFIRQLGLDHKVATAQFLSESDLKQILVNWLTTSANLGQQRMQFEDFLPYSAGTNLGEATL